jgi:hypothetical protein
MDLIRFIFACFGIFANTIYSNHSLQNIRRDSHTNIRFDAKLYSLKIFLYCRIFASKYSLRSEIRTTFCEFHIQANIRIQYSLRIASNYLGKSFTSLRPRFFLKLLALKGIFASPLRFNAKQANKTCLFASKQINIRFTPLPLRIEITERNTINNL